MKNDCSIIDNYINYLYQVTSSKGLFGDKYDLNPFYNRFIFLLEGILDGTIKVERKNNSKNTHLSWKTGAKTQKYVIYGRTNKSIINKFCKLTDKEKEKYIDKNKIGDYIYKQYQEKRKYNAEFHTLEELTDFINFTGDSITDILVRSIYKSDVSTFTSLVQYIEPEHFKLLDELPLYNSSSQSSITLPAFAIPSYGITILIRISAKDYYDSKQSLKKFEIIINDPLDAIDHEFKQEYRRSFSKASLEHIENQYKKILVYFSTNPDLQAFKKPAVYAGLKDTKWHTEFCTFKYEQKIAKNKSNPPKAKTTSLSKTKYFDTTENNSILDTAILNADKQKNNS